jgi:AcrR family transcriptional regulator
MNAIERRPTEDTRARIMEAAWDLFRELGARATVADVAARLGMSSANVYRFFPSKQALCEAVCANQLGAMSAAAREMASADAPAAERLRAILVTLFEAMREQMTNEARVHEIVDVAIREHWAPIEDYEQQIIEILARLVAEGQLAGEFGPGDPQRLSAQTLCACLSIHHPAMIAKFGHRDVRVPPQEVVDFVLRALSNREGIQRS